VVFFKFADRERHRTVDGPLNPIAGVWSCIFATPAVTPRAVLQCDATVPFQCSACQLHAWPHFLAPCLLDACFGRRCSFRRMSGCLTAFCFLHSDRGRQVHSLNFFLSPQNPSGMSLRNASLAVLRQKKSLLSALQPAQYTQPCLLVGGGSVGQHLRHSLDHFRKLFEGIAVPKAGTVSSSSSHSHGSIQYDVRDRGTEIEKDLDAARREVERLIADVKALSSERLKDPVQATFVLSAEGDAAALCSTVGRELGFCTHHAIHHHALIKAIASDLGIQANLPHDFGLAPSTAHHQKVHSAPS